MSQRVLSGVEIQDVAFRTTGQRNNSRWKAQRYGKLTSSNFGRGIAVMDNPHLTNVNGLSNDLYNPKNLDNIQLSEGALTTSRWPSTRTSTRRGGW